MERLYYDVKELLHKEISKIVEKGSLTPQELDNLYKAIDVLKDICEINSMESDDGGYSERGYSMWGPNHDRYYDIHAYRNDGNSYRRNSMGRYSRTDAKEHMIDGLYSMMGDASSEAERGAIQDCINRLKT